SVSNSMKKDDPRPSATVSRPRPPRIEMPEQEYFAAEADNDERKAGTLAAILAVILLAGMKLLINVADNFGLIDAAPAQAVMNAPAQPIATGPQFGREEMHVLTELDARRVELEERRGKLDERELEMSRRDKEFAVRLAQLRELTEALKSERGKDERKRS